MSSWALNNITAPDNYTSGPGGSTLDNLPVIDHVNIDVTNSSIFWQLKLAQLTGYAPTESLETLGQWDTEVFMFPGSKTIDRPGIVGVRVRAAVPLASLPAGASQAQVTVEAVY